MVLLQKLLKLSKILLLLVFTVLLTGCFSSPPPSESILHSDSYSTLASSEQRTLPEAEKIFTIEDAVRIGLANNPTYEKISLALDEAYNTFYQDLFNYLPTVAVTGDVGIGQTTSLHKNSNRWTKSDSKTAGLTGTGSFTVFNGLQQEMDLLASYEGIEETAQGLKFERLALINQIINLYYSIVLTKAQIEINKDDLQFQKEMWDNALFTYKNNLVTYDYVLNFEYNYKVQQSSVIRGKMDFKTQEYVMAALLGLTTVEFPEDIQYLSTDELVKGLKNDFSSLGIEFYLDMAIDQRPDLKQSRSLLKQQQLDLYSAWGAFSPTLSVDAGYGLNTNNWDYTGQHFTYGIGASWDIIDTGMSRIFSVRSAQISLAQSKLDVLETWIDVVKDVRTAYVKLQTSMIQQEITEDTLKIAEQQRDMVKEKYENQLESISRLNDVQTDFVQAQLNRVTAIVAVYTSKTDLHSACGIQRY